MTYKVIDGGGKKRRGPKKKDKTKDKTIQVRVDDVTHHAIEQFMAEYNVTKSKAIRDLIGYGLVKVYFDKDD